jgi:hypothetical protein
MIPATAVTAATLAGTLAYTATNTSVSALSTAAELGINGTGFIVGKVASTFISPIVGASISTGSGFAASAVKETIQSKGKLVSIASGSVAGLGAAVAVTAGSYLLSGLQSVGSSIASTLHNWARSYDYSESSKQDPVMWGMDTESAIKSPTEEIEFIDEIPLISPSQPVPVMSEESNEFMKQVEKVVAQLEQR